MNNNIEILFNSHKIKYTKLSEYDIFKQDGSEKHAYFFIELSFLLDKFLYTIGYNETQEITDEHTNYFLIEFLNLISHYKNFLYNKCDILNFFYIMVDAEKYKNDNKINKLIDFITKIIITIPRINFIYYKDINEKIYLKYNLMYIIKKHNMSNNIKNIFIDMCKIKNNELYYKLSKEYYIFKKDKYETYLYSFNDFKNEHLGEIDDLYIDKVISLITLYETLEKMGINNSFIYNNLIIKYIEEHEDENYNDLRTKLYILKLITNSKKYEKDLIHREQMLTNKIYKEMIIIIMRNWKKNIHDKSILNINEMLNVPKNKRINIELLLNN